MNTVEKNERITIEERLVKRSLPDFRIFEHNGVTFFSGLVRTELKKYKLRLVLDPQHPRKAPKMFIVSPRVLYTDDGRNMKSLGCSHDFHTEGNVCSYVQISYTEHWDASCTCIGAIMKSIAWIYAYEEHLRMGKSIEEIRCHFAC